jgi:hypothetical protein
MNKRLQAIKSKYGNQASRHLWATQRQQVLDLCLKALEIELFPKQDDILRSTHRVKVIRSARNTAKTYSAALCVYQLLFFSGLFEIPLNVVIAAPKAGASEPLFKALHKFLSKCPLAEMFPNQLTITYDNFDSHSNEAKKLKFINGTQIKTATCDSPQMKDVRGQEADIVIVDEFGLIEYKQEFLSAALYALNRESTLNQLWIIGTVDIAGLGEVFDQLFKKGQDDLNIKSWHLIEEDNPYRDLESATINQSLVGADSYMREAKGEPVPTGGSMFKQEFNANCHVASCAYDSSNPTIIDGIDFGYRNSICLFGQYKDGIVRIIKELHVENNTIEAVIPAMQNIHTAIFQGAQPVSLGCDKAGDHHNDTVSYKVIDRLKQFFPQATFKTAGPLVSKINQVNMIKQLLLANRLVIDPSCHQLIRSFVMAQPDPLTGGWKKEKNIDHALDALAYMLINYGPTASMIKTDQSKEELTLDMLNKLNDQYNNW